MPTFRNAKSGQFKFEVKPVWFTRRWFPYFVGDIVKFKIRFTKEDSIPDGTTFFILEFFGDNDVKAIKSVFCPQVLNQTITFVGNPIDREGDIRYGLNTRKNPATAFSIVSAHVSSKDRWLLGCMGLLAGFIIAVAAGIVTGALQIDKFWHIINPLFK